MTKQNRFMLALWVAAILVTQSGCASNKPPMEPTDASYISGGAIRAAFGHGESLKYDLDQACAYITEKAGRLFIDGAYKELGAIFVSMTEVMTQENVQRVNYNIIYNENTSLKIQLENEREQWFGDRTHKLVAWIVGIGATAIAGLTIAHFVLGGTLAGLFPWTGIIRKFFPKKVT